MATPSVANNSLPYFQRVQCNTPSGERSSKPSCMWSLLVSHFYTFTPCRQQPLLISPPTTLLFALLLSRLMGLTCRAGHRHEGMEVGLLKGPRQESRYIDSTPMFTVDVKSSLSFSQLFIRWTSYFNRSSSVFGWRGNNISRPPRGRASLRLVFPVELERPMVWQLNKVEVVIPLANLRWRQQISPCPSSGT